MSERVVVLIPALNEEEALPHVLAAMPDWIAEVVVVDNGSTDDTVSVARDLGATVVREAERGYGAACLAGIRHLNTNEPVPDIIVFVDADGSDDLQDMERLVHPICDRDD